MVDEDGSQQIEFDEFLSIIKGGNTSVSNYLYSLFRKIKLHHSKLNLNNPHLQVNQGHLHQIVVHQLSNLRVQELFSNFLRN